MDRPERSHDAWDIPGIVAEYEQRLVRYATVLTGDVDRARDIVQETFLRLWLADPAEVAKRLPAWLYTVCRNLGIDAHRKDGRIEALDAPTRPPDTAPGPGPDALAEVIDEHRRLLAAMADLPLRQQEVLRLRLGDELSYREISEVTGLTQSYVGYLIHVALRTLRARLEAPAVDASEGAPS